MFNNFNLQCKYNIRVAQVIESSIDRPSSAYLYSQPLASFYPLWLEPFEGYSQAFLFLL